MAKKNIRVLVVDDSMFMREFISSSIADDPSIEVVGKAADAYEARDKIIELEPDVMTLDIQMPKMDGISFLNKLMPQYPLPVVVVSAVSKKVFDALDAGAVDFITKSSIRNDHDKALFISEMIVKIKIASVAKVGQFKHKETGGAQQKRPSQGIGRDNIIAIGASTGGTEAIYNVLKGLGNDLPGIVIVQHMPPVFTKLYAERLNNSCMMEVKEAKDGDIVKQGRVLIAPGGLQMRVVKCKDGYCVKCTQEEKVSRHCPSVDVLFDSIARIKRVNSLGIIMTGMGSDGARGLLAMRKNGATTFGQNEKSCIVYGMPAVAMRKGAVQEQLSPDVMPKRIYGWYNEIAKSK